MVLYLEQDLVVLEERLPLAVRIGIERVVLLVLRVLEQDHLLQELPVEAPLPKQVPLPILPTGRQVVQQQAPAGRTTAAALGNALKNTPTFVFPHW